MLTLIQKTPEEIETNFFRYISSPPENSRIFEITPALAMKILEAENTGNRKISAKNLQKLINAMLAGAWGLTGDTIKFSSTGHLLDGQHRLKACAQSGEAFITHVVFGLDAELFSLIDSGRTRTPSDIFKIKGYAHSSEMAGACRWLYVLEHPTKNPLTHRETPPVEKLFAVYERVGEYLQTDFNRCQRAARSTGNPVPLMLALSAYVKKLNPDPGYESDAGDAFSHRFDALLDTMARGHWSEAPAMSKALEMIQRKKADNDGRIHDRVRVAVLLLAIREHMAGRKGNMKLLDYKTSMPFPRY